MKTIKKVASTPIDTTARVIDSFNTTDDQHTNAPSLNAVKNYIENNCKVNGDFAVLTGDYNDENQFIQFPSGFNKSNCVAISVMIDYAPNNQFISRFDTNNPLNASFINFGTAGIYLKWISNETFSQNTYKYIIVLMKVS